MPTIESDHIIKDGVITQRPSFGPKQVTNLKQIKRGRIFIQKPDGALIKIESAPYQDVNKRWCVTVVKKTNEHAEGWSKTQTISLADNGVVQYTDGRWNTRNWLSRR
jgi:hypothetical protein